MIVDEELLEEMYAAVANGQFRLADTKFILVIEEMLQVLENVKDKVDAIEAFLTSDEEETPTIVEPVKEEKITEVKQESSVKEEPIEEVTKEVKPKAKKTEAQETNKEQA